MKALLDTHTFLWWVAGSDSLSDQARGVLEDRTNQLYLSAVVSWEIAILVTNRKIALAGSVADFVNAQISLYELEPLPISLDHTFKLGSLPYDPDHRDPW